MPVLSMIILCGLLAFATFTVFVRSAWALQAFQIGIYALVAAQLLLGMFRKTTAQFADGATPWLVYLIPLWGVIQIIAHTTASTMETRQAVLRWGALAGVFFLAQVVASTHSARRILLNTFLCFATAMAVLCLAQLFASEGRVLWMFSTGYPDVYGSFPYHNNYAQFVELALPIALWGVFRGGWRAWNYALAAGILYASVIGSASRTGALICTAELAALLGIVMVRPTGGNANRSIKSTAAILLMVTTMAGVFTLVVGWERVWNRFKISDPYSVRREYLQSAIDMAKTKPLTGYGLGTFPEAYQLHAVKDFPFYANHAHNDWAEFAADGGVPFLILILIPFITIIPTAIRHPWGFGLVAIIVHACVDYPFPRPGVSGWIFFLLGLLYATRTLEEREALSKGRQSG